MDIAGKVALVTGGASGIGKAMIEMLLQKKVKVIYLVDINEEASKTVQEELHKKYGDGKIRLYQCDVSSSEQMEDCFKKVTSDGELHIVCNNAGIVNEINWQRMVEINLNGVVIGTKLAVKYMGGDKSGGGVIINTASVAGLCLIPFVPMYSTVKCAVVGFTRHVATFDPEAVNKGIRVNAICPPVVKTPLILSGIVPEDRYKEDVEELLEGMKPHLETQDVAKHFVKLIEEPHTGQAMFIASHEASELINDHPKTFREEKGIDKFYNELVAKAAK